jgi:hypothetical protein
VTPRPEDEEWVQGLVLSAFRLGYEARRAEEPKGIVAGAPGEMPAFVAQHVVVHTADGRICGGAAWSTEDYAVNLAELMSERSEEQR